MPLSRRTLQGSQAFELLITWLSPVFYAGVTGSKEFKYYALFKTVDTIAFHRLLIRRLKHIPTHTHTHTHISSEAFRSPSLAFSNSASAVTHRFWTELLLWPSLACLIFADNVMFWTLTHLIFDPFWSPYGWINSGNDDYICYRSLMYLSAIFGENSGACWFSYVHSLTSDFKWAERKHVVCKIKKKKSDIKW